MPPETQKIKMLKEYWDALSEAMTRTEFLDAFKKVTELIMATQKRNAEEMEAMGRMHEEMMKKLEGGNSEMMSASMQETKKKMMDYCMAEMEKMYREHEGMMAGMEKMMQDHQDEMNYIYDKAKSGKDGKDADEEVIVGKVLAKIELKPKETRDKLESLKGEERLDKSAIKGLEEEIKNIREILFNIPRGRSMGRARVPIVRAQNLTSQVDGVVSTFTLDPDTTAVLGVFSTQFPINFNAGTDWTFAGRTLTLVTDQVGVPQSGQTLWALTEVLFSP